MAATEFPRFLELPTEVQMLFSEVAACPKSKVNLKKIFLCEIDHHSNRDDDSIPRIQGFFELTSEYLHPYYADVKKDLWDSYKHGHSHLDVYSYQLKRERSDLGDILRARMALLVTCHISRQVALGMWRKDVLPIDLEEDPVMMIGDIWRI